MPALHRLGVAFGLAVGFRVVYARKYVSPLGL